jgi:hypothetical protein
MMNATATAPLIKASVCANIDKGVMDSMTRTSSTAGFARISNVKPAPIAGSQDYPQWKDS